MRFKLNLLRSEDDPRDWRAENIYAAGELPETFSVKKQLGPIRNQGSFGTCAAQTAVCMKEYQEYKEDGLVEPLSPMFVYAHRTPAGSPGMFPRDVMEVMQKYGSVAEKDYKYKGKHQDPQYISDELRAIGKNFIIKNYARIATIDALKRALIADGPCFIGLPAFNFGDTFWKAGFGDKQQGGHAVAIVGYDKKGFILRNSWGYEWGDRGYGHFPYTDWGIQWEVWTTIDELSDKITDYKYKAKKNGDPKTFWIMKIIKIILEWIRS